MPYCKRCGIEIDQKKDRCPLCGEILVTSFTNIDDKGDLYPNISTNSFNDKRDNSKDIKIIWSIIGLFFSVALFIFIVILIKFPQTKNWVFYPIVSIIFFFGLISIIFFLYRKIFLTLFLVFIDLSIFLFFIDFIDKKINWFLTLGLPIIISVIVLCLLFYLTFLKVKTKGWNIFGFILIYISFFCILIDFIICFYSFRKFDLIWSPFVLAILIPISIYFLYLHYGAKKKFNIDRFFHLN
ncbi:MAG: hypothetical protein N3A58_08820 [Spirochaetes bacterium]|nr:hypothetical protein [Spirochaetota bacterium]